MIELAARPDKSNLKEIQRYLRAREISNWDKRLIVSDLTGRGRGVVMDGSDSPVTDVNTGRGLCLYYSKKVIEDLSDIFPDVNSQLIAGEVNPRDSLRVRSHRIGHFWTRLSLPDGTKLFVDDSYGQIHFLLNRTVLDYQENEPAYYGSGMQVYPYEDVRSSGQVLEELKARAVRLLSSR